MKTRPYDNIIEILDVIQDEPPVCVECESPCEEEHKYLAFRPWRTGARLLMAVCDSCEPFTQKATTQIVLNYIGPDNEYGLKP